MRLSILRAWAITAGLLIAFPALSVAQGYRIAFAFVSGRIGEQAIYVMDADGSHVKCLTGCKPLVDLAPSRHRFELLALMDGAWSPDGLRLIFYGLGKEDSDIASKYNIPFHVPLYVIGANGAGLKRLLDVPVVLGQVSWSPEGKRLLFTSAYEDPHRNDAEARKGHTQTLHTALYILDLPTATSERIKTAAETDMLAFPSWSPDGTKVVFTCGRAAHQSRDICIVNVDGTHEQELTTPGGNGLMPTWASDGRHIAFVDSSRSSPDQAGVYVMEADGTNQKRISKLRSPSVSWSPDGKSIMIGASGGVYIVNVQGNYASKLPLGSACGKQVFSPDGRSVVYRCNEEGKSKIYAINVDGSDRRRLGDDTLEANTFAVSPLLSQ